jgi:hypothetical protein
MNRADLRELTIAFDPNLRARVDHDLLNFLITKEVIQAAMHIWCDAR